MTNKLIAGVDSGSSGAWAIFADGEPIAVHDMPTFARAAGGMEVDGSALAAMLRTLMVAHNGADFSVALEAVSARPGQGVSGVWRFGQSDGKVRGVLEALGISYVLVTPQKWKKAAGLLGTEKDASRAAAIRKWPALAPDLRRIKDCGRADALHIGHWLVRDQA